MTGRLFIVVGPSGAGKDTLPAGAKAADPALHWARRVITRPENAGSEPFEGVSRETFTARLQRGEFALHWQAHGLCYGVPAAELAPLGQGRDVLVNGSRGALPAAQIAFPRLVVIRITAPSPVRAERLAAPGAKAARTSLPACNGPVTICPRACPSSTSAMTPRHRPASSGCW